MNICIYDKIIKFRFLLLAVGGILTSLTLIFPTVGFLEWITLIPAAFVLLVASDRKELKIRKFYGYGFVFFMCYYLVIYHWFFYMYPMDFTGMSRGASAVVVAVAWLGLSAFQAVWSALVFPLYAGLSRTSLFRKLPVLKPFAAACIWTAFEWSQTIGWWGVPWGRLCLGQSSYTFMLQSASLFGSYFITFLLLIVNFSIAYMLLYNKLLKTLSAVCAGLLVFNIATGIVSEAVMENNNGDKITAAAIQGNISSHDKWSDDSYRRSLEVYEKYTLEAAENGADLVVWPETALPYNIFSYDYMVEYVSNLAKEANVTILISAFTEQEGADYTDNDDDGLYNSIIEVKPDGTFGEVIYSKRHLVPFGEFVPMRSLVMTLIPPLANIGMLEEDLLAGQGSNIMDTEVGKIGCGVCFDSIYEHVTREAVNDGAELICISTNDSWFWDSAAVYMHNSQSKLRAIETGRYLVRAANTGVSSIISPTGEILQELGALKEGYIMDDVYIRNNVTLYSVIGNLFVYLCIAFAAGGAVCSAVIHFKENKKIKQQGQKD